MKSILRWWRANLARRAFGWLTLSILVTTIAVSVSGVLLANPDSSWHAERARWERYASLRFGRVWDDPPQRDALIDDIANGLELTVHLTDAEGNELARRGEVCDPRFTYQTKVRDESGSILGELSVCNPRKTRWGWRFLLILAVIVGTLALASLAVARRLGTPLRRIAEVADRLGHGDLEARAPEVARERGEIGTLAVALNTMADRVQHQLRTQKQMLAEVSHELRTPLGHLRILLELARNEGLSDKSAGELEREINEMDELVDQLMASSRLDFDLDRAEEIDLVAIAVTAVERAGLDPTILDVGDSLTVRGDPALLGRALANLLANAEKHGGGATRLGIDLVDAGMEVVVEDDGPGVGPDAQRLFEPFVRERASGTLGLGLALVQRIAHAHQGTVFAEDRPNGGARVGLVLPL